MAKRGKKYTSSRELVDSAKLYTPEEAVALVKKAAYAKFDETVELHMRLGVDPRHADQQVRGVATLPSGSGKTVRILVFAEGEAARLAQEAGADYVGVDEYVEKIQQDWYDFDVAIAIPQVMGKIGRLGRFLGRRGLMPNPKAGTIVQPDDLPRVIAEARGGRVEFRVDRTSNLHVAVGKVSFTEPQLLANVVSVMDAISRARPSGAKGQYIRKVVMASTMGPGIKMDASQMEALRPTA